MQDTAKTDLQSNNIDDPILPPSHFDGWTEADYDAAKARYMARYAATCPPLAAAASQPKKARGRVAPLVNRSISQTNGIEEILVYPSSIKLQRKKYVTQNDKNQPPLRGAISGFSEKSRRKLRFLAGNTSVKLISQTCLTYHNSRPDGYTVKKHLNSWMTIVKKHYPNFKCLWVLEFQTRGVPHFHVWHNLPHDLDGLRSLLAKSWNRIAEPSSCEHMVWHNRRKNHIAWDMYSPSYLCKYLDKESQKAVPLGFVGVGRFWGNSRGLLAIPDVFTPEDLDYLSPQEIDKETGESRRVEACTFIVRTLGKLHELKLKQTKWKSRVRRGLTSTTLQTSAPQFRQMKAYLEKLHQTENNLPF